MSHERAHDLNGEPAEEGLTGGRLLLRNTGWNLAGLVLPMLVGLLAIPPLVHGLGAERFGLLSLGWVVIGYFSFFDLGIGRALTKLVADRLGDQDRASIPALVWTSLILTGLLGLAGTMTGVWIAPWLVREVLNVSSALHSEALYSFWVLALSIPIVTVSSGLRGVLEAQQQFRTVNLIRIPLALISFLGPLAVLPFSTSLVAITGVLLLGRIVGALVYWRAVLRTLPAPLGAFTFDRSALTPMVTFGGWMTVTNIVGPLIVYTDRFLIGAVVSLVAVTYYTAPFEIVARILVIPGALAAVLFPAFATGRKQGPDRTTKLLRGGVKLVCLATFPIVLVVSVFAPEGLRFWLGAEFASNSSTVLRWLAAGVFVNCLAHIPFAFIQGVGRPDLTAKLHVIELPIYLLGLWFLTNSMGIVGAAIAWTARNTLDAIAIAFIAGRLLSLKSNFVVQFGLTIAAGLAALWFGMVFDDLRVRLVYVFLVVSGLAASSWYLLLDSAERVLLFRVAAIRGPRV